MFYAAVSKEPIFNWLVGGLDGLPYNFSYVAYSTKAEQAEDLLEKFGYAVKRRSVERVFKE